MASESVQRLKFGVLQGTNLNNPYGAQGYTRSKVEKAKTEKWKCLCISVTDGESLVQGYG